MSINIPHNDLQYTLQRGFEIANEMPFYCNDIARKHRSFMLKEKTKIIVDYNRVCDRLQTARDKFLKEVRHDTN